MPGKAISLAGRGGGSKQIAVRSCAGGGENQLAAVDFVDEQPVVLDVALAVPRVTPGQRVVAVFGMKRRQRKTTPNSSCRPSATSPAPKGMTRLARELDLDRKGRYKSLSTEGNPSFNKKPAPPAKKIC